MSKRIPVIPTLLVLAAVAVMVRLGFWQLDRMHQKETLLAGYQSAQSISADAPWPASREAAQQVLYRHTTIECVWTGPDTPSSGRNAKGEAGWIHSVPCKTAEGAKAEVVLGWSRDIPFRSWRGGRVSGVIAQSIQAPARLIADPPLAGLEANARPDPSNIPNNHWSYAIQWFLFAATALVIYVLALRKRLSA